MSIVIKAITSFSLVIVMFGAELRAQGNNNTLDVVAWNVEWFGASFENPPDDNLQEANVKTILRYLNADIYGLTEVVDTMRLRKVVDSLGSQCQYVISPYASGNTTGTGASWQNGQKLAFIYNKNIFTNVSTRGLLRGSTGNAYTNFASGRFPFLLTANVTINGFTREMNFILIHGKAGSSTSDYAKRFAAAAELKDSLDLYFSNSINLLIGDFNDALHTTICTSCGTTVSSYNPIIKDSTDADHYRSITLPLGASGQSSMTNYPNVVDNHVISNEAHVYYKPNSVSIRTEVENLVIFYDATTSDHYPVYSQYDLSGITSTQEPVITNSEIRIWPNPMQNQLSILFNLHLSKTMIRITDVEGRILYSHEMGNINPGTIFQPVLRSLNKGIYFVHLQSGNKQWVRKLVRL